MIVIVIDEDRNDLECYEEGDIDLFEDTLSILWDYDIVEIYFVNVNDETWRRLSDDSSIRLKRNIEELKREIEEHIKSLNTNDKKVIFSNVFSKFKYVADSEDIKKVLEEILNI